MLQKKLSRAYGGGDTIDVLADLGSHFLPWLPLILLLGSCVCFFASSDRSLFWVVGAWCVYDFHSRLTLSFFWERAHHYLLLFILFCMYTLYLLGSLVLVGWECISSVVTGFGCLVITVFRFLFPFLICSLNFVVHFCFVFLIEFAFWMCISFHLTSFLFFLSAKSIRERIAYSIGLFWGVGLGKMESRKRAVNYLCILVSFFYPASFTVSCGPCYDKREKTCRDTRMIIMMIGMTD